MYVQYGNFVCQSAMRIPIELIIFHVWVKNEKKENEEYQIKTVKSEGTVFVVFSNLVIHSVV